jgi:integrase
LYGCGLLYGSSSVRLQDLDFDREQLKVVQGKVKDRYVPLSKHLIRGLKTYIEPKSQNVSLQRTTQAVILIVVIPNVAFNGQSNKPVKQLGLPRRFVHTLAHFATHRRRTRYYHT